MDVNIVDKLTPAARELISARDVAASVIPYVVDIKGDHKVAKM